VTSERLAAARALANVPHPDVAKRLLKELKHARDDELIAALLDGLAGQIPSRDDVGPAVVKLLTKRSEVLRKMLADGDPGFPLDPRTGDPDLDGVAGKAALARLAARDRMIAAGMRCLLSIDYHERLDATVVTPFLQSAEDDLVVVTLEAIARYEMWPALPAILDLFKMYPRDNRWETGAAHDFSGTGTTLSAKLLWMLYFGHPKKRIPRPRVVQALKDAVKELSGVEVEDPADLSAMLRRKDIREKVEGRKRHR
jgi:hypothetical protein